jgi:glutathione synthase/RimK-type ligase-like ATP-grasp enzyme
MCIALHLLIEFTIAKNVGFQIPETNVINQKKNLNILLKNNKKFITKVLSNSINFTFRKTQTTNKYVSYTELIKLDISSKLNQNFVPSLIQVKIEKKHEIRVFIFENMIWPMCIISQNNKKTRLDFRNYDLETPNRCVPYKLPKEINKKILQFMKRVSLNTGSIDLIVTKNNEYVFLEVNPDGQFDNVSFNCNYYIEKQIAELLCCKTK